MTVPGQELRARMENRLPTVFVGLDRLRGQEGGDPGYHELAQALRRLAGRLVHGIASEAERARRERFVVELDVLIGQTLVDLAVDIGRCLQTGAAWGRRHDGRAGVCRPVGGAVRRAPRRLGGDATRSGARRATCGPFYGRQLIGANHTAEDQWHETFGPTETAAPRACARRFRNQRT